MPPTCLQQFLVPTGFQAPSAAGLQQPRPCFSSAAVAKLWGFLLAEFFVSLLLSFFVLSGEGGDLP